MKKTQNNHDVHQFASELHWLAFCYVAGEMTAQQTIQFEQRIAEDFDAQVAVADAVSLSSSIYTSIENLEVGKVSVDRSQPAAADRSTSRRSSWRWVAAIAAAILVIVSSLQLWRSLPGNHNVASNSTVLNERSADPTIGLNELELWARTVEIYRLANAHEDESDTYSNSSANESLDEDYSAEDVDADDDSGEIADALLLDGDLASIFASAISSLDLPKGEL